MKDKALGRLIIKSTAVTLLLASLIIAGLIAFEVVNLSWWWVGLPLIGSYSFGVIATAIHMANLIIGDDEHEA